jgi:VanZ family protein
VHNKRTYLLFALLWTIIVTILSLISINSDIGSLIKIENKDKFVHFTFYFVFVILWSQFVKSKGLNSKAKFMILLSAMGYGILMEICQELFTETRTADVLDVLANSLGAALGLIVVSMLNKNKEATQ